MKYTQAQIMERQSKGEQIDFCLFWGHTASPNLITKTCFSQWWLSKFEDEEGFVYQTAEHYMMAGKAKLFDDISTFEKILATEYPKDVKALGREVKNFDAEIWDKNKFEIVKNANFLKFSQDEALKKFLLSSDNQVIVEASPMDRIWGIGMGEMNANAKIAEKWRGENLLGFALMEVRDLLKK